MECSYLYCMATFGILELWRVVEWLRCYICQLCVYTFFVLWNVLAFKRSALKDVICIGSYYSYVT